MTIKNVPNVVLLGLRKMGGIMDSNGTSAMTVKMDSEAKKEIG